MEENKALYSLPEEGKVVVTSEDVQQSKIRGVTLSQYLDEKYKSNAGSRKGLCAFDAALLTNEIIVRGNPKLGVESSKMEKFFTTTSNRLLFPEFIDRTIRQTIIEQPVTQYLIGETVTITGDTMRQPILDLGKDSKNRKNLRNARVAEGATIPSVDLKLADQAVRIYKYGRAVKATYEVLRRTTIDMFRTTIELLSKFIDSAEEKDLLDVIENGDGNNNSAKVYKRSELNAAGEKGVLDNVTLLKFLMSSYPLNFDTVVANQDLYLQLANTSFNGTYEAGVNQFMPFTFPQGIFKGLTVLYSDYVDKEGEKTSRLFGLNQKLAIRKIIEQGSSIRENEKYSDDQTQKVFITENAGFGKIYDEASAILEVD